MLLTSYQSDGVYPIQCKDPWRIETENGINLLKILKFAYRARQSSVEGRREGRSNITPILIYILTLLQVKTTAQPNMGADPLYSWLIRDIWPAKYFSISNPGCFQMNFTGRISWRLWWKVSDANADSFEFISVVINIIGSCERDSCRAGSYPLMTSINYLGMNNNGQICINHPSRSVTIWIWDVHSLTGTN